MVVITREIGGAMVAQLDRVNGVRTEGSAPDAAKLMRHSTVKELQDVLDGYEYQLEQMRQQLRHEREWNQQLEAELAQARGSSEIAPAAVSLNGRPVITCAEAAKRSGCSVATVNRYLNSAFWQGVQQTNGRWLVYADQPFTRKAKV